jgi:hypothetical protein
MFITYHQCRRSRAAAGILRVLLVAVDADAFDVEGLCRLQLYWLVHVRVHGDGADVYDASGSGACWLLVKGLRVIRRDRMQCLCA